MVHIMMATYNGEKFIREQLDSILSQTYTDWKLYISDDGSMDHTVCILKQYEAKHSDKIFLVDHATVAHSAKKNFAYLYNVIPPAEFYALCDQDDIWEKNKLACMINCIEDNDFSKPILAFHDMKIGTTMQNLLSDSFYEYSKLELDTSSIIQQILLYNVVPGCAMVFNHKVKILVNEISEECIMHDWWLILATICLGGKIIYCNQKLSFYRQHEMNQIGVVKKKSIVGTLIQCFDFKRLNYYIKNNHQMKTERLLQAKAIIDLYGEKMERKNLHLLEQFLELLTCNRRLYAYIYARKNGFIFYNKVYTVKFFLL